MAGSTGVLNSSLVFAEVPMVTSTGQASPPSALPAPTTVLPEAPRLRGPRRRVVLLATMGSAGVAIAAITLATAAGESSSQHQDRVPVSEDEFVVAANAICLADYREMLPAVQANAANQTMLIRFSSQMARKLAGDVSALPHPDSDEAAIGKVRNESERLSEFLEAHETAFASQATSDALVREGGEISAELKKAYLSLGLTQCASPQIAGMPRS